MILARLDFSRACLIATREILSDPSAGNLACAEYADCAGKDFMTYDPGRPGSLDPDFKAFVARRAAQLVRQDAETIGELVDADGWLTVYRAMVVPSDWPQRDHDGTGLGIHWAWSEDCAVSHHGERNDIEVRIRARVHVDDVDWTMTVALNASDDYTVGTENEIRLYPQARVEIELIEWRPDIFDDYVECEPPRAPALA